MDRWIIAGTIIAFGALIVGSIAAIAAVWATNILRADRVKLEVKATLRDDGRLIEIETKNKGGRATVLHPTGWFRWDDDPADPNGKVQTLPLGAQLALPGHGTVRASVAIDVVMVHTGNRIPRWVSVEDRLGNQGEAKLSEEIYFALYREHEHPS